MQENPTTRPAALRADAAGQRLPWLALLALTTAALITVLTEALPAGVLPAMSADLKVSESSTGQLVTVYAIGTALTAIPLSAATAGWRRKRLLLTGVAGFAVANLITASSGYFPVTLASRFVAGVAAGVVWSLLVGYARGMAPGRLQGKAVAIVMSGIPIALSLGVPAGTFLGRAVGWRVTFTAMSVLAAFLIAWIIMAVPDSPGKKAGGRLPILRTFTIAGVAPVLVVTLVFVLAHTVFYTYISTFLNQLGMGDSIDLVLLDLGVASMLGIWVVGAHIDRRLRTLTIASCILVAVAAAILTVTANSPALVYVAVSMWGLGWGGVPTLLQTAAADAGGEAADTAQAMLVTLWNAAMAGGGVVGGILLTQLGPGYLPWSVLTLLAPTLIVVIAARAHGFPATRRLGAIG